ncbi:hypothetical protein ACWU4D_04440 [Vibrio sp. WJH972]
MTDQQITLPQTVNELITEYYNGIKLKSLQDSDVQLELEKHIENNLIRFESNSNHRVSSPSPDCSIDSRMTQFVVHNNLSKIKVYTANSKSVQTMINDVAKDLNLGYRPIEDHKYSYLFKLSNSQKSYALLRPEEEIAKGKQSIREGLTSLMKLKLEEENKELLDIKSATTFATLKHQEQVKNYNLSMQQQAKEAALAAQTAALEAVPTVVNDLFDSFLKDNKEFSLSVLKAVCQDLGTDAEITTKLSELGYESSRKSVDGTRKTVWSKS